MNGTDLIKAGLYLTILVFVGLPLLFLSLTVVVAIFQAIFS